jgi:hypothetical protein
MPSWRGYDRARSREGHDCVRAIVSRTTRCDVGRGAGCRLARCCHRGDPTHGRSQRRHGQAKRA